MQSGEPLSLPSPSSFASGLLIGGSPAQLAMRAQAVLPAFPSLTPPLSASSHSPSSSPPLHAATLSDLHITHVHLGSSSASPALLARREQPANSLSLSGPPLPPAAAPSSSFLFSTSDERVSPAAVGVWDAVGVRSHKAAICALLEALQTTMFTRKKEALDVYQQYLSSQHPRFTRSDALLLLYGSPVTPNSTLSSFHSTANFTRTDRGLLAASGQLSWKNHQLRASATKALGVVSHLLDARYNADAAVFHALIAECDYSVVRLMKLPKHLCAPSPSSSAQGNLQAALRVIDIVKDIRPDLIDALLEEKDAAAAHSSQHSRQPAHSIGGAGPRSAPPTLHINIQSNSAAGSPRGAAVQLDAAAPPSPRSPTSPPPLPIPVHEAFNASSDAPLSSTPHRAPPPLPAAVNPAPHQQPPPLPTLHFATPPSVNTCLSPHSALSAASPWATALDGSGASPTLSSGSLAYITQPLSACSSPHASKKKQFGSLPAGLQRSNAPSTRYGTSHSPASGGSSGDDWKQRLRSHLSGFFAHRVSREELERSGVLKPSLVFGVALCSLSTDYDAADTVPPILQRCLDLLSAPDVLALPGLFRISGDSREIGDMKVRLDVGEQVDLHVASPHSVAGLLKMWLRDLPEPLLTFELYAPIIAAVRAAQQQQQQTGGVLDSLRALLAQLPAAHRATLDALLDFLHRVSAASGVNLMTANNLAICFSPNILRPRIETLESVARDTPLAIQAVTQLIQHSAQQRSSDEDELAAPPLSSSATPQLPASPTSPASPSSSDPPVARIALPATPPPIPSSPRSMSLPAESINQLVAHCSPTAARSPPPIPSDALVANRSIAAAHPADSLLQQAADKHFEEEKSADIEQVLQTEWRHAIE